MKRLSAIAGLLIMACSSETVTPITPTPTHGVPATILLNAGFNQTAMVGTPVAVAPTVQVKDAFGDAVSGTTVQFSVSAGGGTVIHNTEVTDASGVAGPGTWSLGTAAGLNSLTVTAGTVVYVFSAVAFAGPPSLLALQAGDGQSALALSELSSPIVAVVSDQYRNPVQGQVVSFDADTTGGAVGSANVLTDAAGRATYTGWRVGRNTAAYALRISAPGVAPIAAHAAATGIGGKLVAVSSGAFHTCGLTSAGAGYCWGAAANGQLGDSSRATVYQVALRAVKGGHSFSTIGAGREFTCALDLTGDAYCWGTNDHGQLGDGTTVDRLVPTRVAGGLKFQQIAAGGHHACGISSTKAYCWGWNAEGQLGDNATADNSSTPSPVSGQLAYSVVTPGDFHTCGLTASGLAYCWGKGGRIGNGTAVGSRQPSAVAGARTFKMISAGQDHTCGLLTDGTAYCWGLNPSGEIGDGTTVDKLAPSPVSGGLIFQTISAGGGFTCGSVSGSATYCWGFNSAGQLGLGSSSFASESVPRPVTGGLLLASISANGYHTCGTTTGAAAVCWGNNTSGELGLGRTSPNGRERSPVAVFVP